MAERTAHTYHDKSKSAVLLGEARHVVGTIEPVGLEDDRLRLHPITEIMAGGPNHHLLFFHKADSQYLRYFEAHAQEHLWLFYRSPSPNVPVLRSEPSSWDDLMVLSRALSYPSELTIERALWAEQPDLQPLLHHVLVQRVHEMAKRVAFESAGRARSASGFQLCVLDTLYCRLSGDLLGDPAIASVFDRFTDSADTATRLGVIAQSMTRGNSVDHRGWMQLFMRTLSCDATTVDWAALNHAYHYPAIIPLL